MIKTISLPCYNRPEYLKETVKSLSKQTANLDDYRLVVTVDRSIKGKVNKKVMKILSKIDFIRTQIIVANQNLGINGNTFAAIDRSHKLSYFNLYIEDDIVLSPDALSLFEWYTKQDLKDTASLVLCNLWYQSNDPKTVHRTRAFSGWGFGTSREQYEKYFKPTWFAGPGCWDTSAAVHIRRFDGVTNIVPDISRARNIGAYGTNMTTEKWNHFMGKHSYNNSTENLNYILEE